MQMLHSARPSNRGSYSSEGKCLQRIREILTNLSDQGKMPRNEYTF
jgi:hypothetical protein